MAWHTIKLRSLLLDDHLCWRSHPINACQELKCARGYSNLCFTRYHISTANLQYINKWSLISSSMEQRVQVPASNKPHWTKRSFTGSLSRLATQKLKACLGTMFLNHTTFDQSLTAFLGRRNSQVFFVENLSELSSGDLQMKVSNSVAFVCWVRSLVFPLAGQCFGYVIKMELASPSPKAHQQQSIDLECPLKEVCLCQ